MAKYKAYPEYKDSGVEWIDSIPSYWEVKPTFALCDASTQKNIDGAESNVLSLSYGNIIPRDVETNFGLLPESFNTYQIISCGDVILRLTDLQNDKNSLRVGLAKQKGIITSAYLKLKAHSNINPDFLYRLLHSYDTTKVFYGMGGGLRQSMKFEDFRRLPLLLPPYEEQIKISAFLDHETAKIDNLIEKQQQLIELLKEKRQAVISHAVTKGLNPDVPMKDSGVEWLGEVPEHWSVIPLKHVCALIKDGTHLPPPRVDNGIPLLSVRNIVGGVFQFRDDDSHISHKDYKSLCSSFVPKKGDVLLAIVGATLGKVALVPEMGSFHIQRSLGVFRTNELILPQHLSYIFESKDFQNLLWENAGFSAQPGIYLGTLSNFCVPVPPVTEQLKISEFITATVDKLALLLSQASRLIALIQDRRTALISAAVTGKIDVRDWVAPDTQGVEEPQEATA